MDTIRFVDTTIRDGHQSLWAENMTTGMMLPLIGAMCFINEVILAPSCMPY